MKDNKTRQISFRITEAEYETLMDEKPSWETLSTHLRKILFHRKEMED